MFMQWEQNEIKFIKFIINAVILFRNRKKYNIFLVPSRAIPAGNAKN